MSERVRRLVEEITVEIIESGARSVVLTGSHARETATAESDLDLYAIGEGPGYRLERRGGVLVSVSWRTPEQLHAAFRSPAKVGGLVPGWRQSVILFDPEGIAARSVEMANAWNWDIIGDDRLNQWVAEELTGYAEEVHKLVSLLRQGRFQPAAAQRSILALRLPMIVAVHERILYDSENALWDLVAARLGSEWTKNQSAALGLTGPSFPESCNGALALYIHACALAVDLLDARQAQVVGYACALAS